ncbi:21205_t:CDS:2 [Rhizophagus irregularis]|nr:21205_t:CDS:2 [Rhizophagus irregularis]
MKINLRDKRQAPSTTSTSGSVCQLVLWGLHPVGQLLCCEDNQPCLANSPVCSSTNKMAHCWFISQLDACKRNDALSKTVCQYQDGVYCLKGVTDHPYDNSSLSNWNVIDVILSRNTAVSSVNGYVTPGKAPDGKAPAPPAGAAPADGKAPAPPAGAAPADGKAPGKALAVRALTIQNPKSIICSDSMTSGICQIQDDAGYESFSYDVEICDNSVDIINSLPKISNATTTVTQILITTVTAKPSTNFSNHLEAGGLYSLILIVFLISSLGNIISAKKFGL